MTINTTDPNNAYGAWSDGTGATINLDGGTTILDDRWDLLWPLRHERGAIGDSAGDDHDHRRRQRGRAGRFRRRGDAEWRVGDDFARRLAGPVCNGAGSSIAASGVAVTTNGGFDPSTGRYAHGAEAFNGGSLTFSGGSITTNGASTAAVASLGGGSSVTLSGGTTILTTNDGSNGLTVSGGASSTATGVSVTTFGNIDQGTGFHADGAYNGSNPLFSTGGAMQLTDVTIATNGQGAHGVVANSGGVTTMSGGLVSTSGDNALGLYATGAGSSITTQSDEFGVATTISTEGSFAHGVQADTGGAVTLSGGSVTTMAPARSASTRPARIRASPPPSLPNRPASRSRPRAPAPTACRWTTTAR